MSSLDGLCPSRALITLIIALAVVSAIPISCNLINSSGMSLLFNMECAFAS